MGLLCEAKVSTVGGRRKKEDGRWRAPPEQGNTGTGEQGNEGDMRIQRLATAPVNERGGQRSYLLLRRGQFGGKNLAITWVEGEPGSMQALHDHPESEQVYVIVRGHGLMQVGGETEEVGEGTLVFIPPGVAHAIKNTGDEPLVFVSATSPPFDSEALDAYFRYEEQGVRS
jgi:mannose-6-phosphate isomerase-like protein (cupin superfamily)